MSLTMPFSLGPVLVDIELQSVDLIAFEFTK